MGAGNPIVTDGLALWEGLVQFTAVGTTSEGATTTAEFLSLCIHMHGNTRTTEAPSVYVSVCIKREIYYLPCVGSGFRAGT